MLCEKCKKKNATVYYNYSLNGVSKDIHLCSECAEELVFKSNANSIEDSLFSGLFGEYFGKSAYEQLVGGKSNKSSSSPYSERICPSCGMSETELHRGGRFGCKECYNVFSNTIKAMLGKLHVSCEYKGKVPEGVNRGMSVKRKIEKLRADMQVAVEKQDYEEAARLRDFIKMLESTGGTAETEGGATL